MQFSYITKATLLLTIFLLPFATKSTIVVEETIYNVHKRKQSSKENIEKSNITKETFIKEIHM